MPEYYGKITAAAKYIEKNLDGRKPKIGLILGSGWGSIIGKIENGITVPYTDVPEMAVSTTPGSCRRMDLRQYQGQVRPYNERKTSSI